MIRRTALMTMVMLAVVVSSAGATTATRHQNPHYRVTASLLPTTLAVGGRLTVSFIVTNTTSRARTVEIEYGLDGPSSGQGGGIAGLRLAAHSSWTKTFKVTASDAGGYRAVVRATDRAGTSHAAATATAS